MNQEKVGNVTEEEKKEIEQLFSRKTALNELTLTLDNLEEKKDLYEKVVADMGETSMKFQKWWDEMAKKYQWKSADNARWTINFETNEIYLINKVC